MKWNSKIKQYGTFKSISIVLSKLFKTQIMKFHYLKLNIDYSVALKHIEHIDLDVKELTYNDFLLGDKTVFCGKKLELIKKRCNDLSYKVYGIVENNKLLYSTWISLDKLSLPIVGSKYTLLPEEGLLEDSYCHPSVRGRGLHSQMNFFRLAKLYELGKTKCVAIVLDGNMPAYKVQMKSGFNNLGYFYLGTLLGISVCTLRKEKYDNQ
ncbi:MAG: hypothetical protein LBI82_04145 [Dysgonamonadaceae bacterium]|jgi:hypothetical protein|nr:hypothetical protein [Dysgonamonadaceae bacterium]